MCRWKSFIVIVLFGVGSLFAQQTPDCDKGNVDAKTRKHATGAKRGEWKRLEIKNFSFLVPREFLLTKKQGIEIPFWSYEREDIYFTVYTSNRFPLPSIIERDLPTFSEDTKVISDLRTTIWFYRYETPVFRARSEVFKFPFAKEAYFDGGKDVLAMSLKSKKRCSTGIADKIIRSVRLTPERD